MSFETHKSTWIARIAILLAPIVLFGMVCLSVPQRGAYAQQDVSAENGDEDAPHELQFTFRHTPWEEVLRWIAQQCELSFNLDYEPKGTLNFVDEIERHSQVCLS